MRSNFKPWGTYFRKMFEEIGNIALEHQKLRKFRLITLEFKKKIYSNFDDFRLPEGVARSSCSPDKCLPPQLRHLSWPKHHN